MVQNWKLEIENRLSIQVYLDFLRYTYLVLYWCRKMGDSDPRTIRNSHYWSNCKIKILYIHYTKYIQRQLAISVCSCSFKTCNLFKIYNYINELGLGNEILLLCTLQYGIQYPQVHYCEDVTHYQRNIKIYKSALLEDPVYK